MAVGALVGIGIGKEPMHYTNSLFFFASQNGIMPIFPYSLAIV